MMKCGCLFVGLLAFGLMLLPAPDAALGNVILANFQGTSGVLPADWYVSGGMNGTRLRSRSAPDGQWGLHTFDDSATDPPGVMRNVYYRSGSKWTAVGTSFPRPRSRPIHR